MTVINIALIIAAILLFIIGIIGCIIPGLPGTPLCWAGMLVSSFVSFSSLSWTYIIICAAGCIAVEIINNLVPSYFTKKSGGTKAGSWGSTIGVFAGMLTGQIILIFLGPFIGAFIGEMIHDSTDIKKAFHSACYSFLGFITGTGLRLVAAAVIVVIAAHALF
ncbi:MAG: DUF456 domain-containing protein [Treponema sp.]|nr:DUF456 domain-containing protein [Treponema sp.]